MQKRRHSRARPTSLLVGSFAAALVLGACAGPENSVEDLPGVVTVAVTEGDGDDLGSPPDLVAVTMDHDATTNEIGQVLAALDDELADESVATVSITLEGTPSATLTIGTTTMRTSETTSALVAAVAEPGAEAIEIDDFGEGMTVRLDLREGGLDRVSAVVAQYWTRLEPTTDAMTDATLIVQSDGFRIIRGKGPAEPLLARIAVAQQVNREQPLTGVSIGDSALELRVRSDAEAAAVRGILRRIPSKVGTVRVVKESVDLSGATGTLLENARRVVNKVRHDDAFGSARIRNGELQIGASTIDDAMTLDSYLDGGIDPLHLPIALRYVLSDGSDFGKRAGARFRLHAPTRLAEQPQWARFSVTQEMQRTVVTVHARAGVSYRDAAAGLAAIHADESTIIWTDTRPSITLTPAGPDGREVTTKGEATAEDQAQIADGWAKGVS
ncbi:MULTISPECIES: hypothetical protein [unclassified Nocardioides]|uniref:hypothetical protein n=1 Tax=unclassified Nocardioides TaxID=2615069 RepID=UPI0006FC9F66|nr:MULTISPECIES: hypothetical protein [unclassified Nocardioides]KRA32346.1 hypothetical protein ASD81_12245 [Nocardioides sp. Root614]KRA88998.1 hypothetical protein ASD84_12510 [Nocardioides sp. Root682]